MKHDVMVPAVTTVIRSDDARHHHPLVHIGTHTVVNTLIPCSNEQL